MTLRLVIEHSPHRQPVPEMAHRGGELSIGRGAEADWRLEDPDMFISRKHALVLEEGEGFVVTDVSRGGLFVDGAEVPLGAGRSCELRDGMRLRLGDVVIRAELRAGAAAGPAAASAAAAHAFAADDFFAQRPVAEPPPAPRPASLPRPFDAPRERVRGDAPPEARREPPVAFDDPFTLDPLPSSAGRLPPSEPPPRDAQQAAPSFFDLPPTPAVAPEARRPVAESPAPARAAARPAGTEALAAALLRGLGLDPGRAAEFGPEDMERVGRRFRALAEVLEQSMRSRAREKRNLRVAQTVIGAANVNPLKFMATTEEILEALIGPPRPGYLDGDAAIAGAARDLADHQLRSWTGLQAALRRMIERFDPEEIEREMDAAGRLRAILAGGRSALLWQLYRERFSGIAKAAEDRFLGEVGGDYRAAYEDGGRKDDDG